MRSRDETVPADEVLYRWVRPAWVRGGRLAPEGIDLKGTSVDRQSLLGGPLGPHRPNAPSDTGVYQTTPLQVSGEIQTTENNTNQGTLRAEFTAFVEDDPIESNEAHAEVRISRLNEQGLATDVPNNHVPRSKSKATHVRAQLASRFTELRAPK